MAQPTRSAVHIDRPLSNLSIAHMTNSEQFIAARVFPVVPVDHQSNKYRVWPKNAWFRDEARRRAPGTESAGGGWTLSEDTYSAEVWAFHQDVPDQVRNNADQDVNLDAAATRFVSEILMLRREIEFASTYMTTGVWTTDITGVASSPGGGQVYQWSDYTNSNPRKDIKDNRQTIRLLTGKTPNTLVLGSQVFDALQDHPDLVDRVKYTSSDSITAAMMAQMFNVDRVIIAESIKATNEEGQAEAYGDIVGKVAWLGYVEMNPDLMTASAGYIYNWRGAGNQGFDGPVAVKRFRMEQLESDRIEGQMAFDMKVVAADLGVFFDSIVA